MENLRAWDCANYMRKQNNRAFSTGAVVLYFINNYLFSILVRAPSSVDVTNSVDCARALDSPAN